MNTHTSVPTPVTHTGSYGTKAPAHPNVTPAGYPAYVGDDELTAAVNKLKVMASVLPELAEPVQKLCDCLARHGLHNHNRNVNPNPAP